MTDLTEAARATRMHTIYEAWPRDFRVSGDSAMRVFGNALRGIIGRRVTYRDSR